MITDLPFRDFLRPTPGQSGHRVFDLREKEKRRRLSALLLERAWLQVPLWFPVRHDFRSCRGYFEFLDSKKSDPIYTEETFKLLEGRVGQLETTPFASAFVLGGTKNYWHFLIDHVPRLLLLEEHPELRSRPLLVPENLPVPFRRIVLDLFTERGWGHPELMEIRTGFRAIRDCVLPGRVSWPTAFSIWGETFRPIPEVPSGGLKLFVRRDHGRRRMLRNQEEVARHLRGRGFYAIDPGRLDLREQAALFANSSVIVGVHGAALTNLLFAPRGITVIELTGVPQPFFKAVARHREQTYLRLVGNQVGTADFEIDLRELDTQLEIAAQDGSGI